MEVFNINICCFITIFGVSCPCDPATYITVTPTVGLHQQFAKGMSSSVDATQLSMHIYQCTTFQLPSSISFGDNVGVPKNMGFLIPRCHQAEKNYGTLASTCKYLPFTSIQSFVSINFLHTYGFLTVMRGRCCPRRLLANIFLQRAQEPTYTNSYQHIKYQLLSSISSGEM